MLSLTIHNLGDVTVFECSGRITANDGEALCRAVLSESPAGVAILDLAETTAIDAAGLGMLVSLRAWAGSTGTQLKLMNMTPRVEEVLRVTNLRQAFDVCTGREMLDLLCRAIRSNRFEGPEMPVAAPAQPAISPSV